MIEALVCVGCKSVSSIYTSTGYCMACAEQACEIGSGERVGLPRVPDDRIDEAIAYVSTHINEMADGRCECLVCQFADDICVECDESDEMISRQDEEHVIVGKYFLICCEGYHTPMLRAAALALSIDEEVDVS